jgi:hypothetical protein
MDNSFDEKQWLNDLDPETRMKLTELREQIQEDIVSFFSGMNYVDGTCSFLVSNMCKEWEDGSDVDKLCQIVVDNFKKYEWN